MNEERSSRNPIVQPLYGLAMCLRCCIAFAVAVVIFFIGFFFPKEKTKVYFSELTLVMIMKLTWLERIGCFLPAVVLTLGFILWAWGVLHL